MITFKCWADGLLVKVPFWMIRGYEQVKHSSDRMLVEVFLITGEHFLIDDDINTKANDFNETVINYLAKIGSGTF